MTSTKSAYKSNFLNVFKKTFRQRLVNIIFILAVSVLAPIVCIVYDLFTAATYNYSLDRTALVVAVFAFMTVACGFFSLSIVPKMFKEIYKKQSCDLFFSLPIKRKDYFFAKYTLGALANIAAFLLAGAIICIYAYTAPVKDESVIDINSVAIFEVAICMLLAVIALYSTFTLCAMIVGKRIHYIFMAILTILCTNNLLTGILLPLNKIWGIYISNNLLVATNPIQNAYYSFYSRSNILLLCSVLAIEIVGMTILSFITFKKRKAEIAEMQIDESIAPYILLTIIIISTFTNYILLKNLFIAIAVGILLSALMGMAFSGLFYKKVYTKKTGTTVIAVCLACTIFVLSVCVPSHDSFVKKVPEADQIESVELTELEIGDTYYGFLGSMINHPGLYQELMKINITSEQGINNIIALHNKLVDDETIEQSSRVKPTTLFETMFYSDSEYPYSCKLKYKLKNGKTVSRTYKITSKNIYQELVDVFQTEEVLQQIPPFNIKSEDLLFASAETKYTEEEEQAPDFEYVPTIIDANKLLEAYEKDLLATQTRLSVLKNVDSQYYYYYSEESRWTYYEQNEFSFQDYLEVEDTSTVNNITLYYIREGTNDKVRKQIQDFTKTKIMIINEKYYHYDPRNDYFRISDEHEYDENSYYDAVLSVSIYVQKDYENTINLLREYGIDV